MYPNNKIQSYAALAGATQLTKVIMAYCFCTWLRVIIFAVNTFIQKHGSVAIYL